MVSKFVTAADVARHAGVSRSAVSRTFTPGASVSPETRDRVLAAADVLGYRVNHLARTLHRERSDLVGVVGGNISNPYISAQLDALSGALQRHGLHCMLVNLPQQETWDLAKPVEQLLDYRVRSVVLLSGAVPDDLIRLCAANGTRMVLINRPRPEVPADVITADSVGGGEIAAHRLLAAGCRKVAVVLSASRTSAKLARAVAFTQVMDRHGVPVVQWAQGKNNYETGVEAARGLLAESGIDGVFGVTDEIALGVMNTARHDLGLSVPGDVSVIGFDDAPIAAWSSHRLTTIRQSLPELTRATLEAVLGPANAPVSVRHIPVDLIERGSVS